MLQWFLADLRTGRRLLDLPVLSGQWSRRLNEPETLEATVSMRNPDVIALNMRVASRTGRSLLVCASDDAVLGAGIVWSRRYTRDSRRLQLTAKGVWSYYDHRYILPVLAAETDLTDFTIPDPADEAKTIPNPDLSTTLTGWELGTIAKKLVQQAHAWTGGALPIVFEDDRTGTHERAFKGPEFKNLGTVLDQLTQVEGGPDIVFQPRFTPDRLGVEFVLRTGTELTPQLFGSAVHQWNLSASDAAISDLEIVEDASELAGLAWLTGGRSLDEVLVSRSSDTGLVDEGYPLFERLDSSHSSVEEQATLDGYAAEATAVGGAPIELWSFSARSSKQPTIGSYWEGDFCDIDIPAYGGTLRATAIIPDEDGLVGSLDLPYGVDGEGLVDVGPYTEDGEGLVEITTGVERTPIIGDPFLVEGGTFRRRIVGMSGDERGDWVKIITAPERVA